MNFEAFIRSGQFWSGTWNDVEIAQHHGLLGPWAPRERLLALHARHARLLSLTSQLSASLSLPHVILKGVTAGAAWKHPALRPQSDIDVLVNDVPATVFAWREAGLIDAPTSLTTTHFHLTLASPLFPGVPIELHNGLTNDFDLKLNVDELLSRRRILQLDGHSIPTLSEGTELAYLALHAATHAGEKLRWFFDLREKSHDFTAWDAVVAQAIAWNVPWPIWWALREAKTRLGAAVPAFVLASLAPPLAARARIELATLTPRDHADGLGPRALRLALSPMGTWPRTVLQKLTARSRRRVRG
ncbi:MAG: nucleotidyltransferase family protein [Archangium sp.]